MPCLQPTGDCTSVSGCADCDCDDGSQPVLPKCQEISIPSGTYAYATIVVDANGCIAAISEGEVPVYSPDDCCGDGAGGEGPPGPRGPKGDPGAAATIAVDPDILTGTGTSWTVENIGSSSAAVFQFTAPADTTDDCCPDGFTGNVCGLTTVDGVVTTLPPSIVTGVDAQVTGLQAPFITLVAGLNGNTSDLCDVMVTLNLDAFYANIKQYIDNEIIELSQRIDSIQYGIRINGNTATNTSSSDVTLTIKDSGGTTISTIVVPAGGTATLPNTGGTTYSVYQGTTLLGTYSTTA